MLGWCGLVAFAGGFVLAQFAKAVSVLCAGKGWKATLSALTKSGGMPSGHAASMTAISFYTGLERGFCSLEFALIVAVTCIIIYDATHVRYAVGEYGKALNELRKKSGKPELEVVEGHTRAQVAVGVCLGVVVAIVVHLVASGGLGCWLKP